MTGAPFWLLHASDASGAIMPLDEQHCSCISMLLVSISIPKKISFVVGPSHLLKATGSPNSSPVLISVAKAWVPSVDSGLPENRKSSKW